MSWRLLTLCVLFIPLTVALAGCRDHSPTRVATTESAPVATGFQTPLTYDTQYANTMLRDFMTVTNARLEAGGQHVRVYMAEWLAMEPSNESRTVYFKDVGNRKLFSHFVRNDERRAMWNPQVGDYISYRVDLSQSTTSSGLGSEQTTGALDRSMMTWENVTCNGGPGAGLQFMRLDPSETDIGFISWANDLGGSPIPAADVVHAGWFPAGILPEFVLGVTFTLIFADEEDLTDIDNDHKPDTAWREIYYNDAFDWTIGGEGIDVETVALHEVGHGISQGHFGTAFRDAGGGNLHFAPRAVMNAAYSGIQHDILKNDNAGHCSIWAKWKSR